MQCIQFLKWKLYRCWYPVCRVSHLNTFENVLHTQNFEGDWYLHMSECRIWKTMAWRRLYSGYKSVIPCTCVYSFQQICYCTNTCMVSFAEWLFFFISVTSTEYKILYWVIETLVQNFLSGCKMHCILFIDKGQFMLHVKTQGIPALGCSKFILLVQGNFSWIKWTLVWNTWKLPAWAPFYQEIFNTCLLQALPRKLTADLFKRCASYNTGINVDTAQWSASTLWQEGYGVHLQELSRKMHLTW